MKSGLISNKGSATVFNLPGQDSKRNLSPELPLQPYNPAVTSLVRSMRPAPRNPLYPFSNGLRQPNPSSRPSNSSPTSGILGGNPTLSSPFCHFALLPFGLCPNDSSIFCVKFVRTIFFPSLSFYPLLGFVELQKTELKCPSHGCTHKQRGWLGFFIDLVLAVSDFWYSPHVTKTLHFHHSIVFLISPCLKCFQIHLCQ